MAGMGGRPTKHVAKTTSRNWLLKIERVTTAQPVGIVRFAVPAPSVVAMRHSSNDR